MAARPTAPTSPSAGLPPTHPDGEAVGDYHFELSGRADMRFPLSMCFYKLISRTADAIKGKDKDRGEEKITVKAQYTLSSRGC